MPSPSVESAQPHSIPAAQASQLLISFTHFLTVCIHNILYYRSIYPAQTFLTSKAYNLPVHQSRHPKVCSWVRDAIDAIKAQLVLGSVERLAVVIHDSQARVMERWMFDVATFPAWSGIREGKGKGRLEDENTENRAESSEMPDAQSRLNWTNIEEQFRAALRRSAYAAEKMPSLPSGCTFTIAVELRESGEAPIGHPQQWIPTQRNLQPSTKEAPSPGKDIGGAKTTPLRAVQAGPLFFECWVEEGHAKNEMQSTGRHTQDE